MQKLPVKLEREPLVDAVFEVRVNLDTSLADVLPGFLMHELGPNLPITRLPAADLPLPVRRQDPKLQFATILRIEWDNYFISCGDRNVVISCKLPYPKWPSFKDAILKIMSHVALLKLKGSVERYSLKYINILDAGDFADQIGKISMNVQLGGIDVKKQQVSLQVHDEFEDIVHIYSIVTGAQARSFDGQQFSGVLVDIDSIRRVDVPSLSVFAADLESGLDELRAENKQRFFNCLKSATIEEMGAIYE